MGLQIVEHELEKQQTAALTTHQAASWKRVAGFPEGGARAPVCGRPRPEWGAVFGAGFFSVAFLWTLQGEGPTRSPRRAGEVWVQHSGH